MNARSHCKALLSVLWIFSGVCYSLSASACSVFTDDNRVERTQTREEKIAAADLVVSGRIVERIDDKSSNLLTARIDVLTYIKGAGPESLPLQSPITVPCSLSLNDELQAGYWWTFFVSRGSNDAHFVSDLETLCPPGAAAETNAPRGRCRSMLERSAKIGPLILTPDSIVVVGPDRNTSNLQSATLATGSSIYGITFPRGTVVHPQGDRVVLPKKVAIGPIELTGRVRFGAFNDDDPSSLFFAEPDREDPSAGQVLLYGAQVSDVSFGLPGPIPTQARFSKTVLLKGYHVADYATFSPEGDLTDFRSGRDQVIGGVQARKCDNVRLQQGKPIHYPFYNPCRER